MQLLKYTGFVGAGLTNINENIQQSKKFLKDRYVFYRVYSEYADKLSYEQQEDLKHGVGNIKLTDFPENIQEEIRQKVRALKVSEGEIKQIERNKEFIKIKEMLGDRNFGFAYLFVYFHFVEKVPIEDMKVLFNKIQQYSDLFAAGEGVVRDEKGVVVNQHGLGSPGLRRPIAAYIDPNIDNNNENLLDDLNQLEIYRKFKRFVDYMPAILKKDISATPMAIRRGLSDCAVAFEDLGKNMDTGEVDEEEKRALQRCHLRIVKRYNTARELLTGTQNYLKGLSNSNKTKFYKAIENTNEKLRDYGAEIVFDEGGILVLEIKSFAANRALNSATSHCIKDSLGHWDSYVGGEQNYNKQYYIYNFNLGPADNNSIIGITIAPQQQIRACHAKNDRSLSGEIKNVLNQFESAAKLEKNIIWRHLTPMAEADIALKKRRVVANREIIKPNLSIEQVRNFIVNDGADPNAAQGTPLHNAVAENNYEKAKMLLQEFEASPNIRATSKGNKLEHTINKAQNLDMIKLLVAAGSELTQEVFKSITDDYEAIKYCLEQGLDPNFDNSLALRLASRSGNIETIKLVIKFGAKWEGDKNMPLCWAAEHGQKNIIQWFYDKGLKEAWERPMNWLQHSRRLSKGQKEEMLDWLQAFIDDGRSKMSEEGIQMLKGTKFKNYAEFVKSKLKPDRERRR